MNTMARESSPREFKSTVHEFFEAEEVVEGFRIPVEVNAVLMDSAQELISHARTTRVLFSSRRRGSTPGVTVGREH